jgi:integral membrane protein (TIGR01906 family)
LQWLIVLFLPIFILLTSATFFAGEKFIRIEYSRPDFPSGERFDNDARYSHAVQTLWFILGRASLDDLKKLAIYNQKEIKHLVDVRKICGWVLAIRWVVSIGLILGLVFLAVNRETRDLAWKALFRGALLSLLFIGASGVFTVFDFGSFFEDFHHLFFEGDSYLFRPSDSLILLYPTQFWFDGAVGVGLLSLVASLAVLILSLVLLLPRRELAVEPKKRVAVRASKRIAAWR